MSQPETAKAATITTAYLGLGSNLGDSFSYLQAAIDALQTHEHITVQAVSPLYCSKPYGVTDQPDFLNAVVEISTCLSAIQLLRNVLAIEDRNGRVRLAQRWTARTLDIDVLLYGDALIQTPELTVPHPELCQRSFVVYPLYDLVGDSLLPNQRRLTDCLQALTGDDLSLFEQRLAL
ncbi:MAG: 2-amino-4-hydroxy-6-hydroxymethyldihydropteridine diphosphokinase [bacterium]